MKGFALVTGASSGIGRELARCAARDGYGVILAARSRDRLEELSDALSDRHGVKAVVIESDLSQHGAAEALWRNANDGRRVDVLVNNAGLGRYGRFADGGWDREREVLDVNLLAFTELAKRAASDMVARGYGRILNVGSTAGFMPGPGMAVYSATKAYVLSLSEAMAQEMRDRGVTVTVLCPGPTRTGFVDSARMERSRLVRYGHMPAPRAVAEEGWIAMRAGRRVTVTGLQNRLFAFGTRILPRRVVSEIADRILGPG